MIQPHDRLTRPRVGLALSGGAARGIAHVGVLRALEENAIRWDETRRAEELLKAGYDAAIESIDDIKKLIARHPLARTA